MGWVTCAFVFSCLSFALASVPTLPAEWQSPYIEIRAESRDGNFSFAGYAFYSNLYKSTRSDQATPQGLYQSFTNYENKGTPDVEPGSVVVEWYSNQCYYYPIEGPGFYQWGPDILYLTTYGGSEQCSSKLLAYPPIGGVCDRYYISLTNETITVLVKDNGDGSATPVSYQVDVYEWDEHNLDEIWWMQVQLVEETYWSDDWFYGSCPFDLTSSLSS